MKGFLLTLFAIAVTSTANAQDTLNVPGEYTTIQSAIDSAKSGDLVLAADGLYLENINFKGKAITVASRFIVDGLESHVSNTTIDGSQPTVSSNGSVVTFNSGEDTTSVLCGFTITGGTGTVENLFGTIRMGGGILAYRSGATIQHNIIESDTLNYSSDAYGGGIGAYSDNSKILIIRNNIIRRNVINTPVVTNYSLGAGIYAYSSNGRVIIVNNKIIENTITAREAYGGGIEPANYGSFTIFNNVISGNVVNATSGGAGAIDVYEISPLIRNNVIAGNKAPMGGGIMVSYSTSGMNVKAPTRGGFVGRVLKQPSASSSSSIRSLWLVNNTIVNNAATTAGGGMYIIGSCPQMMNFILWGNTSPSGSQIYGNANIQYSDVQGGYAGTGNKNADPDFADTVDYYLENTSACIDAGNPDSSFDDLEDPSNPGSALFPALGTLRSDMGAYGGFAYADIKLQLLGPNFRAFVEHVNSLAAADKQAAIDSFLSAASSIPYIEDKAIVYYLYQGSATSVNVPGDANGWVTSASPMTKLDGTNLWYCEAVYESDARLDYKFYLNGTTYILDPLNPKQVNSGLGPNSELAMPDYVQPDEIEYYPNIPHGNIDIFTFTSSALGNTRTIKVYTPFNYQSKTTGRFPVLLLHDGLAYLDLCSANNILDYLISLSKIAPIICVFVPPVDRDNEYAFTKAHAFESFIVNELMPHIDSVYRTTASPQECAMAGLSYGGLITTQICYNHPERFGLAAAFSPSYLANNMAVYDSVLFGPKKNIKWYIDWGTYEWDIMSDAVALKDTLIARGYDVSWNAWHEAHSWGNWRAHLDNALKYFFPVTVAVGTPPSVPTEFELSQNYPNPFNPSTTINYQLPLISHVTLKVYDVLGREVATLVNERQLPGTYTVQFDGSRLASGVYFYRIKAGSFTKTMKLVLLK